MTELSRITLSGAGSGVRELTNQSRLGICEGSLIETGVKTACQMRTTVLLCKKLDTFF